MFTYHNSSTCGKHAEVSTQYSLTRAVHTVFNITVQALHHFSVLILHKQYMKEHVNNSIPHSCTTEATERYWSVRPVAQPSCSWATTDHSLYHNHTHKRQTGWAPVLLPAQAEAEASIIPI